jgi:Cdc6-like AAA superfamily ATPase
MFAYFLFLVVTKHQFLQSPLLKQDQFRTCDIISWHLEQTLAGENPPPLRMILYGEGGTGKSKVIQTVTEAFAQKGVKYILAKAVYVR